MEALSNRIWLLILIQEAGTDGGKTQQQFEELLKGSTTVFVVCSSATLVACAQSTFLTFNKIAMCSPLQNICL